MTQFRFHSRNSVSIALLAPLCLLVAFCAKVADPRPPDRPIPPRPQPPQVIQVGSQRILLQVQLPAFEVQRLLILRACPSVEPLREHSQAEIGAAERAAGVVEYEDPSPSPALDCAYAVRFESRGRRSEHSAAVSTLDHPVALPPSNLRHRVSPDAIGLEWDPPRENVDGTRPARIDGYLINGRILADTPSFDDPSFEFGQPQTYRVQTVSRVGNPLILSEPSAALTAVPQDVFPPAAPTGVSAVWVGERVQLIWEPNEESDLKGYYLYRGTNPLEMKRATELIAINRYTDDAPADAEELYYEVTAADVFGNESEASETVVARRSRP